MSGDSPNALTTENVFDFNPAPTTSKEQPPNVISASALVEPSKDDKDKNDKEKTDGDEMPEICSPIFNNPDGDHHSGRRDSDSDRTIQNDYSGGANRRDKSDEGQLLNGGPDSTDGKLSSKNTEEPEDSCIVNCLYYTMECCQCSVM